MAKDPTKTAKSVRCVRDLRDFPPSAYRLPTDGRKWKVLCVNRQRLALLLATYADGDGTRIEPSVPTMASKLELCPATVDKLIADLKVIGLLENTGRTGRRGTACRVMHVEVLTVKSQDSATEPTIENHKSQDSTPQTLGLTGTNPRIESTEPRIDATKPTLGVGATVSEPSFTVTPPPPPNRQALVEKPEAGEEAKKNPATMEEQNIDAELTRIREYWRKEEKETLPEQTKDTAALRDLIRVHGKRVFLAFKLYHKDPDEWGGFKIPSMRLHKFIEQYDKWDQEIDLRRADEQNRKQKDYDEERSANVYAIQHCIIFCENREFIKTLPADQQAIWNAIPGSSPEFTLQHQGLVREIEDKMRVWEKEQKEKADREAAEGFTDFLSELGEDQ